MDGESLIQVIFFIVVGFFVLMGTLFKKWQEARQRAEAERRRLESRTTIAPPPLPAVPYEAEEREEPESEEAESEEQPEEQPEREVVLSPLEEFRRFVREAQEQQQRRTIPTAQPVRRPAPPRPARRPVTVSGGEEGPAGRTLAEVFAEKDSVSAARPAAMAEAAVSAAAAAAAEPSTLADILASDRTDLAKAVIVREVLGPPLALLRSPLPYRRN